MKARFVFALIATVILAVPSFAEDRSGPVGKMTVNAAGVDWVATGSYESLELVIGTPDGGTITRQFTGNHVSLRPSDLGGAEGTYTFELRAIPRISGSVKGRLAAARAKNDEAAIAQIKAEAGINEPVVQAGAFVLHNGAFIDGAEAPYAGAKLPTKATGNAVAPGKLNPTPNDVVTADDAIIQGSLCVGLDCVNNESFGFDTIRLKENNTRIKFDDTSTTAGCPNNDWQLTANDACGGANKFSIEDITGAKVPFTITAAAPTNSLFIASSGKVGFGNNNPGLNLHITATDTPAIRQEQTNGGGFTAQTWDIGANEANWFVRDLTGGSRLPLRIRPGAPTSSIDIAASGKVGVGTASPATALDVFGANAHVKVGNDSTDFLGAAQTGYGASNGTEKLFFAVQTGLTFLGSTSATSLGLVTNNSTKVWIDTSGNVGLGVSAPTNPLQHSSGAFLSAGGTWTNASSRSYKQDITDLSDDEAKCALEDLKPVKYAYKVDPSERHVGFIAEDVPELVATKDRKSLSPMDIVAVLTKVVQQQQNTIDELKARLDQIEKKQ
jgi:hypothetical protein